MSTLKNHSALTIGLLAAASAIFAGCQPASPPPRVAVPDATHGNPNATYEQDPVKPLPSEASRGAIPAPPYDDQPLVTQRPPEQRAFVEAYERVGKPRIAVLLNPQLRTGAEDDLAARSIDYMAMETILADWFSSNGRVALISPTAARQRLSDQQIKALQSGDAAVARQVAEQLTADVMVLVQVETTRQVNNQAARIVAEAVNVRGGQSVGRAVVDVPPPLEKPKLNEATRFLARKMMDDMTNTWNAFPVTPPPGAETAPAQLPATGPIVVPPTAPPIPPSPPTAPPPPPVAPPPAAAPTPPVPPTPPVAPPAPANPTPPTAPVPPAPPVAPPIPPAAPPVVAPAPATAPVAPPAAPAVAPG